MELPSRRNPNNSYWLHPRVRKYVEAYAKRLPAMIEHNKLVDNEGRIFAASMRDTSVKKLENYEEELLNYKQNEDDINLILKTFKENTDSKYWDKLNILFWGTSEEKRNLEYSSSQAELITYKYQIDIFIFHLAKKLGVITLDKQDKKDLGAINKKDL